MKSYFAVTTKYRVLERVPIGDVLRRKNDRYRFCYLVMNEDDDPVPVSSAISWLMTHNKNKKIYVLKYFNESSQFTED